MITLELSNDHLRVTLREIVRGPTRQYFLDTIELKSGGALRLLAHGGDGEEFATSVGSANASECVVGERELRLTAKTEWWEASEVITLDADKPILRRRHTYRFLKACDAAIHPGWRIEADGDVRYTFPLRAHEQPLAGLKALRSDVAWALPLPFHVWHNANWVALYGVDRTESKGTLDFLPPNRLRVYYPDTAQQHAGLPDIPHTTHFAAGEEFTITEVLAAQLLAQHNEPLLEAERIAASILLRQPPVVRDLPAVAHGIAEFHRHCELWEPDALGAGRGWFRNMWVFTQRGTPAKSGHMSGYYDMGWGEGIAVETITALTRHWKRTGRTDLLPYVDEMTRNMELFKRNAAAGSPYFDRSDGKKFGDFLMDHVKGQRVWTHSLGHTSSQLITTYEDAPNYPKPEVRAKWLEISKGIGSFFANRQKPNGDLNDIFDEHDREVNHKPHRIAARAVVCGLWARLARATGEKTWLERAQRLARSVAPEIERYEYFNQMCDGIAFPTAEFTDGEAAYYVLEGLVPLYEETRAPQILALCRKAAAFGIAWTYFYDVPNAHRGIARGGQCCRMPDYPLLYPIGPAKGVEPLLRLSRASGDEFYRRMAGEMVAFISNYQWDCPGKPWHGGMIHAIEQWSGNHWGPDKSGQVDSGMATGNSLAAIEFWLAHHAK